MGLDLFHYIPTDKGIDYLTVGELSANPEFLKNFGHLLQQKELDGDIIEVLYLSEIGYQRKGMNDRFYKDFENDGLYFSVDDVKKAKTYIRGESEKETNKLLNDFQQNFIDNFTEGKSVFEISW